MTSVEIEFPDFRLPEIGSEEKGKKPPTTTMEQQQQDRDHAFDAEFKAILAQRSRERRAQRLLNNSSNNNSQGSTNSHGDISLHAFDLLALMSTIEDIEAVHRVVGEELLDEAVQLSNFVLMLGGADLLSSPSSYIEKHRLTGSDDVLRFAVGRNVILHVEPQQQPTVCDSARAKTQMLTEYKWDNKTNYAGRILAARDKLVACRLFNETTGEAVRVLEREERFRHLIKDFRHPIVDLQWAVHAPLLAVLDANANLYIYSVDENGQKLTKYLNIIQEGDHTAGGPARLVWCPFIPEEEPPEEPGEEELQLRSPGDEVHLLAVIQGKRINLFMLNKIKEEIGRTEVTYERVGELKGGMMSLELESEVTACRISPDATALAAATASGELFFYVMEQWERITLANRLRPLPNNHVEELVFLDNLTVHNHDEQFWKYVAISSDNGRRLALFNCDTWSCVAKLRFECPNQVSRMELLVEPSMRFLFVADYDASNLFCIELSQPSGPYTQLCFAACTQIVFSNPMICVAPCSVADQYDSSGDDLSLEDEERGAVNTSVVVSLAAITQRSLLELNVELDRVFTVDPSVATAAAAAASANPLLQPRSGTGQSQHSQQQQQQIQQMAIADSEDRRDDYEQQQQQQRLQQQAAAAAVALASADVDDGQAAHNKNHIKSRDLLIESDDRELVLLNNSSNMAAVANTEAVEKLSDLVEQMFGRFNEKIDDLSLQVRQLQDENEQLRANQTDNLSNMLEKISNELKCREERVEQLVRKQNKECAEQLLRSTETLLAQQTVNMQRTVDLAQTRQAEHLHATLERAVIPQVEVFCTQLFQQLNDTFRAGVHEFMDQLKAMGQQQARQAAAVAAQQQQQQQPQRPASTHLTPMEKLNRQLEGGQLKAAFELALNQQLLNGADPQQLLLLTVCKKVDPEVFFNSSTAAAASSTASPTASPPPPLPVPVLLQLLLQLCLRLEVETELKFRYVENALMAVNSVMMASKHIAQTARAMGSGETVRAVMEKLSQAFSVFGEHDANRERKRQIRLMNQLVANMHRL